MTGTPRNLRLKLLFVLFAWYCSAIRTVFQTFLANFLFDSGFDIQLISVDEILQSGVVLGFSNEIAKIFELSSDLRHKEFVERAEICSTLEVCIARIRETGNYATFVPEYSVEYHTDITNDHSSVCLLNDGEYTFFSYRLSYKRVAFFLNH